MKINTGRIIKIIAIILGVIGLIISLAITFVRNTALYSTTLYSSSSYMNVYNILQIYIYVFCIVSVCALIYGIGQIIDLLQKMNSNLVNLSEEQKSSVTTQSEEILKSDTSISPEISKVDMDNMWKRPVSEDSSAS